MDPSPQPHILRFPISKKMAYPVGFEFLQQHFGDIEDWPRARICFNDNPVYWASEFARILQAGQPYSILSVERRSAQHPNAPQAAHWAFEVCPVSRMLKNTARAALLHSAVDVIQDFLKRSPTHWNYYNRCTAIFDPTRLTCTTKILNPL